MLKALQLVDIDANSHGNPLVSIVVPSYNHQKFIEKCITSIVTQSYKNFELIVIDDGSTDNSQKILSELQSQYGFTLICQENLGLPRTLNKAIQQFSNGKYVTFCASDDYWLPGKLEKQIVFMENNPHIPMCYGKAYVVDEDDIVIEKLTIEKNKKLRGGDIFKDILLMEFHPPVNYLFRKNIFDELGYYREDIFTEDLYMNLRISSKYQIGYIDEFLICYRAAFNYHQKFISTKSAIAHRLCIDDYKLSEHYNEAVSRWNFRSFVWYSSYKRHKLFAAKAMVKSIRFFFHLAYAKSLIKLVLFWRKS